MNKNIIGLAPLVVLVFVGLFGAQVLATPALRIGAIPHLPFGSFAQSNQYNFSVSPGTYNSETSEWSVPPNALLTVNGSTNDLSVTEINMTGVSQMGFTFSVQGAPSACGSNCLYISTTIPPSHDVVGDVWTVTVTYYSGSTMTHLRAQIFPTVIVTPEFPLGSLLAIVAPIGALGFYAFARSRFRKNSVPL